MDFYDEPRDLTNNDLRLMLLPQEYWGLELSDIADPEFRKTTEQYIASMKAMFDNRVGLLIWGQPSAGKSAAAAVLAKEARKRYKTAMFITIWDLRESLFNHAMFVSGKSLMQRAKEVDFLVLDGLDIADSEPKAKAFNLVEIDRLVNSRAQQHKLSVITSRVAPKHMRDDSLFKGVLKATESRLLSVHAPDPKDAIRKRKAHMQELLKGGDKGDSE